MYKTQQLLCLTHGEGTSASFRRFPEYGLVILAHILPQWHNDYQML